MKDDDEEEERHENRLRGLRVMHERTWEKGNVERKGLKEEKERKRRGGTR